MEIVTGVRTNTIPITYKVCDCCGAKKDPLDFDSWYHGFPSNFGLELEFKTEEKKVSLDLCPACCMTYFIPFLSNLQNSGKASIELLPYMSLDLDGYSVVSAMLDYGEATRFKDSSGYFEKLFENLPVTPIDKNTIRFVFFCHDKDKKLSYFQTLAGFATTALRNMGLLKREQTYVIQVKSFFAAPSEPESMFLFFQKELP